MGQRIVAALLVTSALAGCAMTQSPRTVDADASFDNAEIVLASGQSLQLSLSENPTTGFRWYLEQSGEPACTLRDDSFDAASGTPGRGGTRRWRFEAVRVGTCAITLVYRRAWESRPPTRTFRLTVRVER